MKIEQKKLSSSKRELTVEVPAVEAEKEFNQVMNQYRKLAVVPGFRKGKVPAGIIRSRFSKEIEGDFYGKMIPDTLNKALKEQKLEPIADPKIQEIEFKPGEPLKFTALLEVKPEISVSGYTDVRVEKHKAREITGEDIDKIITRLRTSLASFEPVTDRPCKKGDFLMIDLWGTFTSGKERNFHREKILVEAGGEGNPPGFNSHVLGLHQGRELEFSALHPSDDPDPVLAGAEIKYRVKLLEIKKRILPESDDAFAQKVSEHQTLSDLRKQIRSELEQSEEKRIEQDIRDKVIERICEANPLEPPTHYIDQETESWLQLVVQDIRNKGMDPGKLEIDWGELRKGFRPEAEKRAAAALILEQIAEIEKIRITDEEVMKEIEVYTAETEKSAEETKDILEKDGRLEALKKQLTTRKTIDFLVKNAKITLKD